MIETALSGILAGSSTIHELTVTYRDVHTLWGGVVLRVEGNGHTEQRRWERGAKDAKVTLGFATAEDLRELIELLRRQKVWEQLQVDGKPAPDEVLASLTIRIAELETVVSEWLVGGSRLPAIKDLMSQLVVSEYRDRGTVNNEANIEAFRNALFPVLTEYGEIPPPSEDEIAGENYAATGPGGASVRVQNTPGSNDPYDSVAATVTLESSNLIEPRSSAGVRCMVSLRYLAWSTPELEILVSGPPFVVRKVKKVLEPALERCKFRSSGGH